MMATCRMVPEEPKGGWERVAKERDAWKEMAEAEAKLLSAYRVGSGERGGKAADAVAAAHRKLQSLSQDVSHV